MFLSDKMPLLIETRTHFATRVASGNSSRHTAAWRQQYSENIKYLEFLEFRKRRRRTITIL